MTGLTSFWMVTLGGALGCACRYYVGLAIASRLGSNFPFATMIINITGCLFLGFFGTLALERQAFIDTQARLFWATGFAGGYTTFSTFGFETFSLFQHARSLDALLYLTGSVLAGLAAIWSGAGIARLVP